jgi:hypothetical protein
VFLQSDVLHAVAAMRDEYEQHAGDVLQLSPLHTTAPVFQWTQEQEYAALAAAAAAEAADAQAHAEQQKEQQQDAAGEMQQGDSSFHILSTAAGLDANGDGNGSDSDSSKAGGHAEVGSFEQADSSEGFVSTWAEGGWLVDNPLSVPTERENYVQNQGGKVFRVLLVKKQ